MIQLIYPLCLLPILKYRKFPKTTDLSSSVLSNVSNTSKSWQYQRLSMHLNSTIRFGIFFKRKFSMAVVWRRNKNIIKVCTSFHSWYFSWLNIKTRRAINVDCMFFHGRLFMISSIVTCSVFSEMNYRIIESWTWMGPWMYFSPTPCPWQESS